MRFLLDTDVVSASWRDGEARLHTRLVEHGHHCGIGAPTFHELAFGIARLPAGRRKRDLADAFAIVKDRLPVLPYDEAAALVHAEQRVRLEAAGRTPQHEDAQIAAIALARDLVVVTRNVGDFRIFSGLVVERW